MKSYILLDRSGSMTSQWVEAIGSINGYVNELKDKKIKIQVAVFDSISYDIVRDTTVGKWDDIDTSEIDPRGSTPLFDSVGKIVTAALEENDKKSVIVIMTDGFENASKEYNKETIKAKLKSIENKKWPTLFLGANFDSIENQTSVIGISAANSMFVTAKNLGSTMRGLSATTQAYYTTGDASTMEFTAKIKQKAAS